ncbi:MAG TPA: type 1 glutamine amidotransferase domain-containing protein [Bacillales bacterium]|nr:type 1 glutamine amidotransferase domain-containing protein [Bacillales bacterium]
MADMKILMVLTNHKDVDEGRSTGVWLEEFAVPYETFQDKGYEVTVVSPKGGEVPVDPNSESDNWPGAKDLLKDTKPLDSVEGSEYDAIFLPGGHGTMFDFPDNETLKKLLAEFYEDEKVVSAVCHGPAGFTEVKLSDGSPLVSGKTITAFTDSEESGTGLEDAMPFLLESQLREQGANFVVKPDYSDHVERDGHLITGQNPPSSQSTALAVIEALES